MVERGSKRGAAVQLAVGLVVALRVRRARHPRVAVSTDDVAWGLFGVDFLFVVHAPTRSPTCAPCQPGSGKGGACVVYTYLIDRCTRLLNGRKSANIACAREHQSRSKICGPTARG